MFDEYSMEAVKQEKLQSSMEKDRQKGLKEGLTEGKKEGLKEAAKISARNLLSFGVLTEEQIAQATGLTLEKVKALKV